MDVTVRKTNGSYEEYDKVKLMNGIREAYKTAGEECPEAVVVSIAENLYIYDKITSREIRRQVEESLMSINKKVAVAHTRFCSLTNQASPQAVNSVSRIPISSSNSRKALGKMASPA